MLHDGICGTVPSQADRPIYRVMRGEKIPAEWVVVSGDADRPEVLLAGFKTEKHAQEAADTLNDLAADTEVDGVLRRMMGGRA